MTGLDDTRALHDQRTPIDARIASALRILRAQDAIFPARRQYIVNWVLETAFRMCRAPRRSDAGAQLMALPLFWTLFEEALCTEDGRPLYWVKPLVPLVAIALDCSREGVCQPGSTDAATRYPFKLPEAMARFVHKACATEILEGATAQHIRDLLHSVSACAIVPVESATLEEGNGAAVEAACRLVLCWAGSAPQAGKKAAEELSDACLLVVDAHRESIGDDVRRMLLSSLVLPPGRLLQATMRDETLTLASAIIRDRKAHTAADSFAVCTSTLLGHSAADGRVAVMSLFSALCDRLSVSNESPIGDDSPAKRARLVVDCDEYQRPLASAIDALASAGIASIQSDDVWAGICTKLREIAYASVSSPRILRALVGIDFALVSPCIDTVCSSVDINSRCIGMSVPEWTLFWDVYLAEAARARNIGETLVRVLCAATFPVAALDGSFTRNLMRTLRHVHTVMRAAIVADILSAVTGHEFSEVQSAGSAPSSVLFHENAATMLTALVLSASDDDRDSLCTTVLPFAIEIARQEQSQMDKLLVAVRNSFSPDNTFAYKQSAVHFLIDRAVQALLLAEERELGAQGSLVSDESWRSIAKIARKSEDASLRALVHCAGRQDHEALLRETPMARVMDHAPRLLQDPRMTAAPFWPAALAEPLPAWALCSEALLSAVWKYVADSTEHKDVAASCHDALMELVLRSPCATVHIMVGAPHLLLCADMASAALSRLLSDTALRTNPLFSGAASRLASQIPAGHEHARSLQCGLISCGASALDDALLVATHDLCPETFCSDAADALATDISTGLVMRWRAIILREQSSLLKLLFEKAPMQDANALERAAQASSSPDTLAALLAFVALRIQKKTDVCETLLTTWPRVIECARLCALSTSPKVLEKLDTKWTASRAALAHVHGEIGSDDLCTAVQHLLVGDRDGAVALIERAFWAVCVERPSVTDAETQMRALRALAVLGHPDAVLALVRKCAASGVIAQCDSADVLRAALDVKGLDDGGLCAVLGLLAAARISAGDMAAVLSHAMHVHWLALMRVRPVLIAALVRCIERLADADAVGSQCTAPRPPDGVDGDARRVARAISDFARHKKADQHQHAGALLVAAARCARSTSTAVQRALAPALCQVVRLLDAVRSSRGDSGTAVAADARQVSETNGESAPRVIGGYRSALPLDRVMHSLDTDDARAHVRSLYALYDTEYRYEGRA